MTMNKIFLHIFFSIIFHSFIFSDGPYSFNTITEQDGLRNGPNYRDGIVYYPIDIEGPLPIIILVPGFVSSISSIEDWGPYLASYGVVTMFVNVNNIFQDPYYRSYALLDGMISIIQENERIDSPLFEMLNIDSIAVGGWSMGGGGAQLAAQQNSNIKAVIALSAWLSNSNVTYNNTTSILFLSGQYDTVAPNSIHSDTFYNNTPESTEKLLFEISGGNHSTVCSPYNDESMGLKALFWIEKYIIDDSINCDLLINEPVSASEFETNVECQIDLIGDINYDNYLNVQDIVLIVNLILDNEYDYIADMNYDDYLNIQDIILLINLIFEEL